MRRKMIILSLLILIFSIGFVSANENITDIDTQVADDSQINDVEESDLDLNLEINTEIQKTDTVIESENVVSYYKEKTQLTSYLKDDQNQPIQNKTLKIEVNGKTYDRITDKDGKAYLPITLAPNTYNVKINFEGDDVYNASSTTTSIKIKKIPLSFEVKDYSTYVDSDLFFKAKLYNSITKNPVSGIRVQFKVYNTKTKKYTNYYANTDKNGVAKLNKNLNVGLYKITTSVSDSKNKKYISAKKSKKITMKVKETAEMGCSSLYVQVSNTEAVAGFRRDATNAKNLHIVKYKLNGIYAVKQYKKNSYFFHTITAANGWMAGTGGWDNPTINHAIEKLAGKMFKSGKINKAYLKKIQKYERQLKIGHFSIKAPNGKYALVWGSSIVYGKLKPGEYICVPNGKYCFRHGTYAHFDKNPSKAAIKIAASDSFGVNRRDATAFHWKATTKEGKTTSTIKVYAANDNGRMAGRSTAHLKDNIYFKGKFISKNSLPKTPSSKFLGTHKMGNIDKLIKAKTVVKAPKITTDLNESKVFKVTVKNKATNKPIKSLTLKLKIDGKTYSIVTDKNGVALFKTNSLAIGNHKVTVYTNNIKYLVNSKSNIVIKE